MKKILSFILAGAAAALTMSSCQKEVAPAESEANVKTVHFNAVAPSTKAVLGEKDGTSYPTTWSANDTDVKISLNYLAAKDATMTPSADGASASISVDIDEPNPTPESYTFYALSPASACVANNAQYKSWTVEFPTSQTPGTKTPDESAMILAAVSESFEAMPTSSVNLSFSHVTAYLDFSILNLKEGVEVESIDLTFGTNVAGRWFYYPEDGSLSVNSGAASINLATSSTENLFVALAPVAASVLGGTQLKVTVNTSDNTQLVKTVTLPAAAAFVAGKVNTLKVDFDGIGTTDADIYTKVTSYDELTAGSKVIIAAAGATGFAISTTQNDNNRAQTAVTKSDDGTQIIGPAPAVEIFTLEAGTADNTVAFLATTTEGYLYAAGGSSKNYLRTQATNDKNSSFAIKLGSVANGDVIVAEAVVRGYMRYNSSSSVFSCYASDSSVEALPSIYKLAGTGSGNPLVAAPVEYSITISDSENGTVTASASTAFEGDEITLTITPAEGHTLDVLTVTNATTSEEIEVTNNKFTMPASDVTVSATFKEKGNTPTLQYTLDGTQSDQGSNGYATNSEITQNGIGWIAVANTTINPWRFGGKNLTNQDRAVYSTTAISSNITSIEVESGTATATVNSLTITVHSTAADAAAGTNAIATKSVTTGITSSTVTLTKEDSTADWSGKYFRIVYNVTCGSSNQYVQLISAKFYGVN